MAINMPEKKPSGMGKALTVGGAVAGGIIGQGSPQAIVAGAGAGSTANSLLSPTPKPDANVPMPDASAINRRLAMSRNSPQAQIRESIDALKFVNDPSLRAELAQPLLQADYMESFKRRG